MSKIGRSIVCVAGIGVTLLFVIAYVALREVAILDATQSIDLSVREPVSHTATTTSTSSSSTATTMVPAEDADTTPDMTEEGGWPNATEIMETAPQEKRSYTTMAWVYPGPLACGAQREYSDGRTIDVLKPEYFTIAEDGTLRMLLATDVGCNGYSKENAASILRYSEEQYVTVSAGYIGAIRALIGNAEKTEQAIATLVQFVVDEGFTGVEIDFEDFGAWTKEDYADYLAFLTMLGEALHSNDKKLMVDVPPISSVLEQSYYVLRYEDFDPLPVDYVVLMAYDYQYDHGVGEPVTPLPWLTNILMWAKSRISDHSRIVVGLPSYGYSGPIGSYAIRRASQESFAHVPGFATAPRDPGSGERIFEHAEYIFVYQDEESLRIKRDLVHAHGIGNISVWALGDNVWFAE